MLFIVLPAYNEELGLGMLIEDIIHHCGHLPLQIVVVDDASTDGTYQLARNYARTYPYISVISHQENRGLGGSLLTGFKEVFKLRRILPRNEIKGTEYQDVIITMDADNTHPGEAIPMIAQLIEEGADLVVASRYASGSKQYGLNSIRRILSWGAGKVMSMAFPVKGLKDYSCGYRGYRASALEKAYFLYGDDLIESRNFAGMVELLLKVVEYCDDIQEVPFDLHYEKKLGRSKMRVFKTIGGYFNLIYRLKREAWGWREWVGE